jgi:hypothetical protein
LERVGPTLLILDLESSLVFMIKHIEEGKSSHLFVIEPGVVSQPQTVLTQSSDPTLLNVWPPGERITLSRPRDCPGFHKGFFQSGVLYSVTW